MKRSAFDLLRRAFDNTLANWPLLLLRLGETMAFGVILVGALFAMIFPILSVGTSWMNVQPEDVEAALGSLITKWTLWAGVFGVISVLLLIFLAVHAFVEAGCARVLVDAERIAGPALEGPRSRYAVFSMSRWLSGGADGWWTLFWIYNLAWAAASVLLLIPLLPTIALMVVFGPDNPELAVGVGCLGLVVTVFLGFGLLVVTSIWTTRAIADWAVHHSGARAALGTAWQAVKADFGRHLVIALAAFVTMMAGSAFFSTFSFLGGLGDSFGHSSSPFPIFFFPVQIFTSLLNTAFSAAVLTWFLAAYGALAVEPGK